MVFTINGNRWKIVEISNAEMIALTGDSENFTHGTTEYSQFVININKDAPDKRRTLLHELMHCYMYEYGHNQFGEKKFDNEDICELSACSHDFIHSIVEMYIEKRGERKNGRII